MPSWAAFITATVRMSASEFFENRGDVKFNGVEGNPQPTRNCFVGDTIRHRREHFKFAGRSCAYPSLRLQDGARQF